MHGGFTSVFSENCYYPYCTNDILNSNSNSKTENFLDNIKKIVEKCKKCDAKNIFISGLVSTVKFCYLFERGGTYGFMCFDSRNVGGDCVHNIKLRQYVLTGYF